MAQAIARCIEVSTTDTFITSVGTANPTQTIYPNILALIADLNNVGSAGALGMNPNYTIFVIDALLTGTVSGSLAGMLGFTGSEPLAGNAIIATYQPKTIWIPKASDSAYRHTSDSNWFNEDPGAVFKGQKGVDGNLSGVNYTANKMRTATWPWVITTNCIEYANSGTAFDADRCFVRVVNDARTNTLSEAGSTGRNCKGVYFIENMDLYIDPLFSGPGLPTVWNSGTPNTGNYVYCSAGEPIVTGASDNEQRAYYDLSLQLTAADAPAWGWDIT